MPGSTSTLMSLASCPPHPMSSGPQPRFVGPSQLSSAVAAAANGRGDLVRVRVHSPQDPFGTDMFRIDDYEPRGLPPLPGDGLITPLFLGTVANPYPHLDTLFLEVPTRWVLVGYFTGASIDRFEWHRRQFAGQPLDTSLYERGVDFNGRSPEFCVVSWCIVRDPLVKQCATSPAFYAKSLSEIMAEGGHYCSAREL
jgi:hypothetical protein